MKRDYVRCAIEGYIQHQIEKGEKPKIEIIDELPEEMRRTAEDVIEDCAMMRTLNYGNDEILALSGRYAKDHICYV